MVTIRTDIRDIKNKQIVDITYGDKGYVIFKLSNGKTFSIKEDDLFDHNGNYFDTSFIKDRSLKR